MQARLELRVHLQARRGLLAGPPFLAQKHEFGLPTAPTPAPETFQGTSPGGRHAHPSTHTAKLLLEPTCNFPISVMAVPFSLVTPRGWVAVTATERF